MLELLTSETPNGWKAAIIIEELGVDYKVTPISLSKLEQKQDWYVALNPNGR
ncbi:MAG: glutathione S-transferase N-terminal domain-containing protein, partial [Sphingomonas sp.]|nr:glutathione S-transferase N-terminal domain-containing protein [Sphingomonas sp.]